LTTRSDLKVWASNVVIDSLYGTPNTLPVPDDLWFNGYLRENPVAAQHLNKVLQIITEVLKNDTLIPSNNLSDLTNLETARTNLNVFNKSNNLSDLLDAGVARNNLNTLTRSDNLNDVPNKSTVRTNLDLYQKSANLADIPNAATARDNLGLNTENLFNTFFDKVYPIGTVYENKTNTANPNSYLGRGTWVAEGQGRVSIGAGSGTDSRGETINFPSGSSGGEYKHVMLESELVPHAHPTNWDMYGEGGSESNKMASGTGTPEIAQFTLATESTGNASPFNITQPYSVYFRWVRVS